MLRRFFARPDYLARYIAANIVFYAVLIAVLWTAREHPLSGEALAVSLTALVLLAFPTVTSILLCAGILFIVRLVGDAPISLGWSGLVPLGLLFGVATASLMHNAVHGNLRPRAWNRLYGELLGLHQLMGFPSFALTHLFHHQFSDDPVKDPHPPSGLTFPQFAGRMGRLMFRALTWHYFNRFGRDRRTEGIWRWTIGLAFIGRIGRAVFLFLALGPDLFLFFYLSSKITATLFYVHFNYFTHRPRPDGTVEILNLDGGLYRLYNALTWGAYFHRNHHEHPTLFDPRRLGQPASNR
jgi:fatty acid desaturase